MDLQGRVNQFVGRERELEKIEQVLTEPESAIIEVFGPPGIGKTELIRKALRDTRYAHQHEFTYQFEVNEDGETEFTIFNLIEHLAADLGVEGLSEDALPKHSALLDEIRRKSSEKPLLIFIDRLDILLSRSAQSSHDNKYYRHLIALLEILGQSQNTKVFLGTAYKFEPENPELKTLSIHLNGLDSKSAIQLIKAYDIKGLPYDMEWAVEDYQGHPVAIKLMCENILHLDLDLDLDLIMDRFKFDSIFNDDITVCRNWETTLKRRIVTIVLSEERRSILRFVALIDHEFDDEVLNTLFVSYEKVHGIFKISDAGKHEIFHRLRQQYALDWHPGKTPGVYTLAPLVQKFYYKITQQDLPEIWNTVHQDLYEYYEAKPASEHPQSEQEQRWLCHAAKHGCAVGKIAMAWDKIVDKRLMFNGTKRLTDTIEDHKLLLPLLRLFFIDPWLDFQRGFPQIAKNLMLNQVALTLVGHSVNHQEKAAIEEKIIELRKGNSSNLIINYSNLSYTYRFKGHLERAIECMEKSTSILASDNTPFSQQFRLINLANRVAIATLKNELQDASKAESEYKSLLNTIERKGLEYGDYSSGLIVFYSHTDNIEALKDCENNLNQNAISMAIKNYSAFVSAYKIHQAICVFYLDRYTEFFELVAELKQSPQWPVASIPIRSSLLVCFAKALLKQQRLAELPAALEECHDYVAHYDLNLSLTDYHLVCAEFALVEQRISDAQTHLHEARKIIDWTGYELVRKELNQLETQAGMYNFYKEQLAIPDPNILLSSLFQLVAKSPQQSQLLKQLDQGKVLNFLQEQLGSKNSTSLSQLLARYYADNAKHAELKPSPLWLAWMQNTQQMELQKIMESLAD